MMDVELVQSPARTTVPDGFLEDAEGRLVPREKVRPEHLLEDELVRALFVDAQALSDQLRSFREDAFDHIRGFIDMLAQEYRAPRGGIRGNVTLQSYDGRLRVQVAVGDSWTFGPELQVAKTLIDQCLTRWSEGADANLKLVVMDAFAVDQQGKINVERVLGLRRLAIDDADWKRAMGAIGDALRVNRSKQYLHLHQRTTPQDRFVQVPLDVAGA